MNIEKNIFKSQIAVGIFMIASPWIFGFGSVKTAVWISIFNGLLVVFLSLWGLFGREEPHL